MPLQLQAKQRLLATEPSTPSDSQVQKEQIDHQIENKKGQVENLKKSMPSRENHMKVSPEQRNRTEHQIRNTENQVSDLHLQKSKIGN